MLASLLYDPSSRVVQKVSSAESIHIFGVKMSIAIQF